MSTDLVTQLEYNGKKNRKCSLDELRARTDYDPVMDILTATRVSAIGGMPYKDLSHANPRAIKNYMEKRYGNCVDWWQKLGVLFPPSGQVKNMLNAALVAFRVPNGGKMIIIGSKYSVGSGEWVELLARWLDSTAREMTIFCVDPNEVAREMMVGKVRVVGIVGMVSAREVSHYDGIVDDTFVVGADHSVLAMKHPNISQKVVKGYSGGLDSVLFLHSTEHRLFSFAREWEKEGGCKCQRCQIEQYLAIGQYVDILEPSPCRPVRPEVLQASSMWVDYVEGRTPTIETLLEKRAAEVINPVVVPDGVAVQKIVGYGATETPYRQVAREEISDVSVVRPGALVSNLSVLISPILQKGWVELVREGPYIRQERVISAHLPRGKLSVKWGGILVERRIDTGESVSGMKEVEQWCLYHRREDKCGLYTDHWDLPLCQCGHRHGKWKLHQWGVDCGSEVIGYESLRDLSEKGRVLEPTAVAAWPQPLDGRNVREFPFPEYEVSRGHVYWYGYPVIKEIQRRGRMTFYEVDKWEGERNVPKIPKDVACWDLKGSPVRVKKKLFEMSNRM